MEINEMRQIDHIQMGCYFYRNCIPLGFLNVEHEDSYIVCHLLHLVYGLV